MAENGNKCEKIERNPKNAAKNAEKYEKIHEHFQKSQKMAKNAKKWCKIRKNRKKWIKWSEKCSKGVIYHIFQATKNRRHKSYLFIDDIINDECIENMRTIYIDKIKSQHISSIRQQSVDLVSVLHFLCHFNGFSQETIVQLIERETSVFQLAKYTWTVDIQTPTYCLQIFIFDERCRHLLTIVEYCVRSCRTRMRIQWKPPNNKSRKMRIASQNPLTACALVISFFLPSSFGGVCWCVYVCASQQSEPTEQHGFPIQLCI